MFCCNSKKKIRTRVTGLLNLTYYTFHQKVGHSYNEYEATFELSNYIIVKTFKTNVYIYINLIGENSHVKFIIGASKD